MIFESPMSQHVHEAIDMTQIQGVETRTGANPLRCDGSPISFTDTMSRSPTSVRAKPPTARRIRICRLVRTTLLHVLATGWSRGQKDDRELERRCRWYSHLCELPFYVPCLHAHSSRGKRLVYSLLPLQHWSLCPSRTSSPTHRTSRRSILQTFIKSSPIQMAPRSLFPLHFPIHRSHFLHQSLPYGSTRYGFSAW